MAKLIILLMLSSCAVLSRLEEKREWVKRCVFEGIEYSISMSEARKECSKMYNMRKTKVKSIL